MNCFLPNDSHTLTKYRASKKKVGYGNLAHSVSNNFRKINLIPCTNLVRCGYFEYSTLSDDEILNEIWLIRLFDQLLNE